MIVLKHDNHIESYVVMHSVHYLLTRLDLSAVLLTAVCPSFFETDVKYLSFIKKSTSVT
jgi:hypothetical protein